MGYLKYSTGDAHTQNSPLVQLRVKSNKPSRASSSQCSGGVAPSPIPPPEPGAPYIPYGSPNQRVMGSQTGPVRHLEAEYDGRRGLSEPSANIQCMGYCADVLGLSIPFYFSTNDAGACLCSESGELVYWQDYQVSSERNRIYRDRCQSLFGLVDS